MDDWIKSREIIMTLLKELVPNMEPNWYETNAECLLARLAQADLLITDYRQLREDLESGVK